TEKRPAANPGTGIHAPARRKMCRAASGRRSSEVKRCQRFLTGSPGGVGKKRTPPIFMKTGDVAEVEIEKIGRLSNPIIEAA
ncbi:MAG: fumarylacetoacetate hydrolase family protein, partial [Burkholderiaceae bacterium]|nr:fumarylacetoacetate hydrolase family protein [Burkholderiaceae bacterium]